ncbi:MAG: hypothetical protein KKG75_01040 [Nanoarchaeota archaeon]|nr:hypothetical protein [Nanoarchaeota archaeon]
MVDKSPDKILYELEHFGIPTRNGSLVEAHRLVEGGQLLQEQVDDACARYQSKIEAENVRKYGTPDPTEKQKLDYALNLFAKGKETLRGIDTPRDFVEMSDGKYTSGEELHTSGLGGCIATLLYFEGEGTKEGILTHYPPLEIDENISKLRELQEQNFGREYQKQRGVVLVERPTEASQLLETGIRAVFPGVTLETVVYDQNRIGKGSLNPSRSEWRTEQHGSNSF